MYHQRHRGFTLIELIMVIVIMSIVSVVVGNIMLQGFKTFIVSQNISEADWAGLQVLETLTNDIHNIRSASSITEMSASSLVFVDMSGTTVTYQYSGSTLTRNGFTLATGLSAFSLGYLDKNGATTATAASVRYVTISLTALQNNMALTFATTVGTRGML